jgi:quinolinate synthase
VAQQAQRELVLWQGSCIVHETFSEKRLVQLKVQHPGAAIIAHPECEEPVLRQADFIGSTSALLKFTQSDDRQSFIVVTEPGIIHQMQKASPSKEFIPAPPDDNSCNCNECPYMRLNTLEKVYLALRDRQPEITMDKDLQEAALKPIRKMLVMS